MAGTSQRSPGPETLGAFLDNVEDAHLVLDPQFRCVYGNPAAANLFGATGGALCGKPLDELCEILGSDELQRACDHVADERAPSSFEHHDAASGRWLDVRACPAAYSRILISFRDITEHKQASDAASTLLDLSKKAASLGTFDWDLRACLIDASPELERLCGTTSRHSGWDTAAWMERIVTEDREKLKSFLSEVYAGHRSEFETDFRVQPPDGAVRWIRTRAKVTYDYGGRPLRMTGVCKDITYRKQAESAYDAYVAESRHSESVLALVQSAARFGIWDWNLETNRSSWSSELFRLYRLDEQATEASYETWVSTIHPDDREQVSEAAREAASAQGHLDIEYRTVDGRWLAGIGQVLIDPETRTPHMLGINIDITYRKQIEEHLRRSNEELRRSNDDLQRFAYVASHDLREPLRMITAFTEMLIRRNVGKLDEDSVRFAGYVQQGAERMRSLIAGLLDYSRVSDDRPERKVRTNMDGLLSFARMHLAPLIAASGATITSDPLPVVFADDDRMLRVFQNLLSNAIKYRGPAAPKIHVSARLNGGHYVFSVRDNGIGFEMKYAEQIFGVFQRLCPRSEIEGAGLGLSIVRRIIEAHGGRVWAESEPGRGSTFYFTLPDGGAE